MFACHFSKYAIPQRHIRILAPAPPLGFEHGGSNIEKIFTLTELIGKLDAFLDVWFDYFFKECGRTAFNLELLRCADAMSGQHFEISSARRDRHADIADVITPIASK